jgi:very-short-patch-repair endonuclease
MSVIHEDGTDSASNLNGSARVAAWVREIGNKVDSVDAPGEFWVSAHHMKSLDMRGVEDLPIFEWLAGNALIDYHVQTAKMTPIERRMAVGLAVAGKGVQFLTQHPIGRYRADFVVFHRYSPLRVVVECDGFEYHGRTREQDTHDKKRDRYMSQNGYRVLRFTGSEIMQDVWSCVSEICDEFDWQRIGSPL